MLTLSIVGCLDAFLKQAERSIEQVKTLLEQRHELTPGRIR
jgi:hypothetical protein